MHSFFLSSPHIQDPVGHEERKSVDSTANALRVAHTAASSSSSNLPSILRSPAGGGGKLKGIILEATSAAPSTAPVAAGSSRRKANMSVARAESHTEIIINGRRVDEADINRRADEIRRGEEEAAALLRPIKTSGGGDPAAGPQEADPAVRLSNSNIRVSPRVPWLDAPQWLPFMYTVQDIK